MSARKDAGETPGIRRLEAGDLSMCITATARAFWPDPLFGHFARSPLQEHVMLPRYIAAVMSDALRHGEVDTIVRGGRIVASASWLRPGDHKRGPVRETLISARCARALVGGRNRFSALALLNETVKHHPKEPHWYLAVLGVDPAHQGRGLGGALLMNRLNECDATGVPAYLETQKPDNVPYYERFGFTVSREISAGGSPPVWLMWREPTSVPGTQRPSEGNAP